MATQLTCSNLSPMIAPDPGPARKRKKRAPTAGAAADCFTCANRKTKCDRRRPYCSQCLEAGQDCSGYKTQLTWGVGVASRGKLRGLSLPIVGTQNVAGSNLPPKAKKRRESRTLDSDDHTDQSKAPLEKAVGTAMQTGPDTKSVNLTTRTPLTPSTQERMSWPPSTTSDSFMPQVSPVFQRDGRSTMSSLQDEQPSTTTAYSSFPASSATFPTQQLYYSHSPMSSTTFTVSSQLPPYYSHAFGNDLNPYNHVTGTNHSNTPNLSSPTESAVPETPPYLNHALQSDKYPATSFYDSVPRSIPIGFGSHFLKIEDDVEDIKREHNDCAIVDDQSVTYGPTSYELDLSLIPFSNTNGIGKTPRMKFLINYYAEVISPVIVAFDTPSNPYRSQLLQLAMKNETLQHAIAALSASNLRQRTGSGALSSGRTAPARRSSMAHMTLTNSKWHDPRHLSPDEQMKEETYHKQFAIQQLNRQLANPILRKDDSILATLLVLCLFHICDSGIAKFQTQFAGVNKLLALRGDELGMGQSNSKWITRMFTWFDALAATVNDRESQFSDSHVELSSLYGGEWCLENLAGVDSSLFKTISRLGRLNVLSQGKAVISNSTLVSRPLPPIPFQDRDHGTLDGNGWVRIVEDENLFSAKIETADLQTQFWREWREIRQELQTWHVNTSLFDSTSNEASLMTPEQRVDLENISECFRFSALLYTERLANPTLPSENERIQVWVRKALEYIRVVRSDVYLLWPLFIAGTECMDEAGRSIIRGRCVDIQKDSGFMNNASCLELLEKVWRMKAQRKFFASSLATRSSNSFEFREVMISDESEGEWIVV